MSAGGHGSSTKVPNRAAARRVLHVQDLAVTGEQIRVIEATPELPDPGPLGTDQDQRAAQRKGDVTEDRNRRSALVGIRRRSSRRRSRSSPSLPKNTPALNARAHRPRPSAMPIVTDADQGLVGDQHRVDVGLEQEALAQRILKIERELREANRHAVHDRRIDRSRRWPRAKIAFCRPEVRTGKRESHALWPPLRPI